MLTVLVASIVSMSSVRNSLLGQYYNQLSQEAADAGLKYAQSCLDANGGIPQWNDTRPLVPGTSCTGVQFYTCPETSTDEQCSVMITRNIKSSFRVGLPTLNSDGKAVDLSSLGIVNLIKTSDGSTWRTYSQSSKTKIIATGIVADNIVLNLDASNAKSYSGGGTAWTDLSGNNNNGVLMNGVSFSNADGGSLIFDGIDDYVNLGTNASLDTGDNVTIGAWVKPSVLSGRYAIYSNRNSNQTGSSQLEIGSVDGNVNTAYFTAPGLFTAKASNNAMTVDNWQYIVYTRIGSLQSIYINGVNATKSVIDTTFSNNNSHKTIGVGSLTSPCYFKGQISAVQVYSRSLSSEEIKQNYRAMAGRYNLRSIQTLIVGGGGSGASSHSNVGGGGGGGGSGGYIYSKNLTISAGNYSVVVGNGSPSDANTASASSFANLIAAAGASGGGAPYNLGVGLSGAASGGGSASGTTAAGSDLSGQYRNGALGIGTYGATVTSGGGGGGAGGGGGGASNSSAGAGGAGVANSISGSSVIYASGGAGGDGSGGIAGTSAAANTGGGGAGGGGNLAGGAGGSGIVIIRYLTGLYSATGGTITTSGDYTIHTFTSSGTFKIN